MVLDAVPVIFRYASSSLLGRFINQYELVLMSEEYEVRREPTLERPARYQGCHQTRRVVLCSW